MLYHRCIAFSFYAIMNLFYNELYIQCVFIKIELTSCDNPIIKELGSPIIQYYFDNQVIPIVYVHLSQSRNNLQ